MRLLGLLVVVGVAAAAGVVVLVWRAVRSERARRSTDEALLDPHDVAELDEALARAEREEQQAHAARLTAGLAHLMDRRVPVRAIEPVWHEQAVRIRFADGTTVLVSGAPAGAFGVLAARVRGGSVCLLACEPAASGTNLVFSGPHGRETVPVLHARLDR